jgi:serine/threonine-protein kinase
MLITFRCESCFSKISAGEELKGKEVICPVCTRKMEAPAPMYGSGYTIDDFVIDQWLGNGAMGEVHLAHQRSLDRPVALKIVTRERMSELDDQQRFLREVRTQARLNHKSIVSAIASGEFEGGSYLAMSYVEGSTVEDVIQQEGSFSEAAARTCALTIADALEYAWATDKILHRDLKPGNFMRDTEGKYHLMDLGIAKSVSSNQVDLTAIGVVMGTPFYMSPEQAQARKLDARSDMYSLGASLYEMLCGDPPYDEIEGSMQVMIKKLSSPPISLAEMAPHLSSSTCKVVEKLMEIDPSKRPQTWAEAKELLQGIRPSADEEKRARKKIVKKKVFVVQKSSTSSSKKVTKSSSGKSTRASGKESNSVLIGIACAALAALVTFLLMR